MRCGSSPQEIDHRLWLGHRDIGFRPSHSGSGEGRYSATRNYNSARERKVDQPGKPCFMSPLGTYRTCRAELVMSDDRGKADVALGRVEV
jgi:hypothetical protein